MLKLLISYAFQISLFGLVLSVGLQSSWADFLHVLRRPALLLRAVVATNMIVPAVMVALCAALPIAAWTKAGLIIMAVSPLAPFAPVKMQKSGAERSYVVGTYVALTLAAVLIVPLTAVLLSPFTARGVTIPVSFVAWFVAKTVFLPLVLGVSFHTFSEAFADRAASIVRIAAMAVIIPVALLLFVRFAGEFPSLVGDGTLAAISVTVAAGLVSGYLLGGSDPATRRALGEAAAARHPGLAAAIAQFHSNDARVLAAIVLFLFASIALSAIYTFYLSRRTRTTEAVSVGL